MGVCPPKQSAMIAYDSGAWRGFFAPSFKGSVLQRATAFGIVSAFIGATVFIGYHGLTRSEVEPLWPADALGQFYVTSILAFLVTFRASIAYSRFWEGATLLNQVRGEWISSISSVIAFCTPALDKQAEVVKFQNLVVRLMSL